MLFHSTRLESVIIRLPITLSVKTPADLQFLKYLNLYQSHWTHFFIRSHVWCEHLTQVLIVMSTVLIHSHVIGWSDNCTNEHKSDDILGNFCNEFRRTRSFLNLVSLIRFIKNIATNQNQYKWVFPGYATMWLSWVGGAQVFFDKCG